MDVLSLTDPVDIGVPVVFDSPHSGTDFPDDFDSPVERNVLLQTADMYVDELYAAAPSHGAAYLCAKFPRVYIDANRPLSDRDPVLLENGGDRSSRGESKSARGIGLIWTIAPDHSAIYDRLPDAGALDHRIAKYWRPYHDALASLLAARRGKFGAVWHVNCHSMPGTGSRAMGDEGQGRPDFIIGDRDGTTCSADFSALVFEHFRSRNYDTRVNELFKGGEIVRRFGEPDAGTHSVQIEMNRRLYMDERGLVKLDGFERFRDTVVNPLIETVCGYATRQAARS